MEPEDEVLKFFVSATNQKTVEIDVALQQTNFPRRRYAGLQKTNFKNSRTKSY
jgi:hypothetical protein